MKIKGSEFMEWYDNHFPKGYFWDSSSDSDIHGEDGSWALYSNMTYDTAELGEIFENDPDHLFGDDVAPEIPDLTVDKAIKRWRKARNFDLFSIEVPKARTPEVLAELKRLGVTVRT